MADSLSPNYVRLSWQGRHSTIRFDLSSDRPFPADAYAVLSSLAEVAESHLAELREIIDRADNAAEAADV